MLQRRLDRPRQEATTLRPGDDRRRTVVHARARWSGSSVARHPGVRRSHHLGPRGLISQIQVGASPRGGLALVQLARAQAVLEQRDFVIPDHVKRVAIPALAHRITLRPELWGRGRSSPDDVMNSLLDCSACPAH